MPHTTPDYRFTLADPDATDAFAQRIARHLSPPDCVLLSGAIGAGKSHFARAAIRAMTHAHQDVPSPTYTLMQSYEGQHGPIWHMDLYRLGEPEELMELGLDTVLDDAIALIEWPERLGSLTPARHLHITISQLGEGRQAQLRFAGAGWGSLQQELSQ